MRSVFKNWIMSDIRALFRHNSDQELTVPFYSHCTPYLRGSWRVVKEARAPGEGVEIHTLTFSV